jgi:hypothetical protein
VLQSKECAELLKRSDCLDALELFTVAGSGKPCDLTIDVKTGTMHSSCQCRDLDARSWNGTCIAAPGA